MNNIIIGNGIAGLSAAEAIREVDKSCEITLLTKEGYATYSRPMLPRFLVNKVTMDRLLVRKEEDYTRLDIDLRLNSEVERIDTSERKVFLTDSSSLNYDNLIIAAGSFPFFPHKFIKGLNKGCIYGLRTIDDVKYINMTLEKSIDKEVVIIGGGLIGIELADLLNQEGYHITLIDIADQLAPPVLFKTAADIMRRKLEGLGIRVLLDTKVTEVLGAEEAEGVVFEKDGEVQQCSSQLVVLSTGVRASIDLAQDTPLETNRGIIVNRMMKTNVDNVYAAGDVAELVDPNSETRIINFTWNNAREQGLVAGHNMAGMNEEYESSFSVNYSSLAGLRLVSAGDFRGGEGDEILTQGDIENDIYKRIVIRDNSIIGFNFIGDTSDSRIISSLLQRQEDVSNFKDKLLSGKLNEVVSS